jgi:uncharacterized protein (TIGR02285 family)
MKWTFLFISLVLFSGIIRAEPQTPAKQKMDWVMLHYPPYAVAPGRDNKSDGVSNKIIRHLQEQLPGFDHQTSYANISTLLKMLREKRNVCSSWVLDTPERRELGYLTGFFSLPPYGIVVRTQDLHRLLEDGKSISLKKILERSKFRLGLEKDRSYGEVIDKLIKESDPSKIIYLNPSSGSDVLVKMLTAGRIDFILEYPQVISYYNNFLKLDPPLVVSEIEESKQAYTVNIICTKNEWGRHLSRQIDTLLQEYVKDPEFRQTVEANYPEETKAKYGKEFEKFYRDRAKGPMTTAPEK